jgi:MYXO-CTERM domain-containing protein
MAGVSWPLFIPIVGLLALAALFVSRRRPPVVNENPGRCSSCETPMSLRRVPLLKSHALLGEWECSHCGSRSKSGTVG